MRLGRARLAGFWCILATVSITSCKRGPVAPAGDDYTRALNSLRSGDRKTAEKLVDAHEGQWRTPATPEGWQWRLLKADLVRALNQKAALEFLAEQPSGNTGPDVEGAWRVRRCSVLVGLRYYDRALAEVRQARKLLTGASPQEARFEADWCEGLALSLGQSDLPRGEGLLRSLASQAAGANAPYFEATAFTNLAYITYMDRRYDTAISDGKRAVAAAEKAGARRILAAAAANLATNYDEIGDYDSALPLLEKARDIARDLQDDVRLQLAVGELGTLWAFQEQYEKAIPFYMEAYERAGSTTRDHLKWAGNLAVCHLMLNQPDKAEKWNEIARPTGDKPSADDVASYLSNSIEISRQRKDLTGAIATCRKALTLAPRNSSSERSLHAQMAVLELERGALGPAKAEFEKALRDVEAKQGQLSDDQMKIGYLSRLIRHYRGYVAGLVDHKDYEGALQIAERSRARVLALRVGRGSVPGSFRARDLARQTGSTLLSYWLAPQRSYLWIVTAEKTKFVELPAAEQIDGLVKEYRKAIEDDRIDPLTNQAGLKLYEILLKPAAEFMPRGATAIIVPDGSLHAINLESLPVPGSPPRYWLEEAVVSIAPGLAIIEPATRAAAPAATLAIGAPVVVDAERYPELPGARAEIQNFRATFKQAETFEGKAATKDVLFAHDRRNVSVIHFAAHGESNERQPLQSAVVLSPGAKGAYKLFASDLRGMNLDADLVTVSGCRTAGSRSYAGEGLLGFAWAFLQSGAKNVVAGLWNVRDDPTTRLMKNLYEGIAAGKSAPEALHDAKIAMVRGEPAAWRWAYKWAAFQCYTRTAASTSEKSALAMKRDRDVSH